MVPRTGGYTYAAKVWEVSIVQGPFSAAPGLESRHLESRAKAAARLDLFSVGRVHKPIL
jgi:hypothetical protein